MAYIAFYIKSLYIFFISVRPSGLVVKVSITGVMGVSAMHKSKGSQDEIRATCAQCQCNYTFGYWDEELSCYIYLSDEPTMCSQCQSGQTVHKEKSREGVEAVA